MILTCAVCVCIYRYQNLHKFAALGMLCGFASTRYSGINYFFAFVQISGVVEAADVHAPKVVASKKYEWTPGTTKEQIGMCLR
jgi:hypothetical protein